MDNQLLRRQAIAITHIFFGCRSMVIPLPSSFLRTLLIQYGTPSGNFVIFSGPDIGTSFSVESRQP